MEPVVKIFIAIGAGVIGYFLVNLIIGYMEKPKERWKVWVFNILGIIVLVLILAGVYIYFFVLSPAFIEKPYMEKPPLYIDDIETKEVVVKPEHLAFMVNEMGGYKLHRDPLSKTLPEFEFVMMDINKTYTLRIADNRVFAYEGISASPDLRIYTKQKIAILLYKSDTFITDLKRFAGEKQIWIELLNDDTSLALKGYKSLYNAFN